MKKKSVAFPVPVDIKVAQTGSVLVTNARPLHSPDRFGANPGAKPVGPGRAMEGPEDECCRYEFSWPSHTNGKGRSDG